MWYPSAMEARAQTLRVWALFCFYRVLQAKIALYFQWH